MHLAGIGFLKAKERKILIFLKGEKDILIFSSRKGELYNCNCKLRNVFLAAYLCGRYYFGRFQVSKQSNCMNIFQGDRFLLDWYTCWFKKIHTCKWPDAMVIILNEINNFMSWG